MRSSSTAGSSPRRPAAISAPRQPPALLPQVLPPCRSTWFFVSSEAVPRFGEDTGSWFLDDSAPVTGPVPIASRANPARRSGDRKPKGGTGPGTRRTRRSPCTDTNRKRPSSREQSGTIGHDPGSAPPRGIGHQELELVGHPPLGERTPAVAVTDARRCRHGARSGRPAVQVESTGHAAVGGNRLSRDKPGSVRGQEHDHVRDVFGGVPQRRSGVKASTASMTPGIFLFFAHSVLCLRPRVLRVSPWIPAGPSSIASERVAASIPSLGSGVITAAPWRPHDPGNRRQVYDRPAAVCGHGRDQGADEQERGPDVHGQDLVYDVRIGVHDGEAYGVGGVVDEYVDLAEGLQRLVSEPQPGRRHVDRPAVPGGYRSRRGPLRLICSRSRATRATLRLPRPMPWPSPPRYDATLRLPGQPGPPMTTPRPGGAYFRR